MEKGAVEILKKHGCLFMKDDYKQLFKELETYYKQEAELKKLRVGDVSVSVCDCTHQIACRICGSKKGLDGDFWDNTAK